MVADTNSRPLLWGQLIHLSYNMWFDRRPHDSYVHSQPAGAECYPMLPAFRDKHLDAIESAGRARAKVEGSRA
jgi:hypothetical protein